jgi:general secretion pathway protein H
MFAAIPLTNKSARTARGFTFIEVMLVIVVVGFLAATISANFIGAKPEDSLKQESERFAAIVNLAAEYSLLNNVELGLYIEDNGYQILGFDGTQWLELPNEDIFRRYQVAEPIEISLSLDGLPLAEDELIDSVDMESFGLTDEQKIDKQKLTIPQVYILSGGELTPFSLEFSFEPFSSEPVFYRVDGLYTTPLTIEGPLTANVR